MKRLTTFHIPALLTYGASFWTSGVRSPNESISKAPLYQGRQKFAELAIPQQPRDFLSYLGTLEDGRLAFDPPYLHEAGALEIIADSGGQCLLATTGTSVHKPRSAISVRIFGVEMGL